MSRRRRKHVSLKVKLAAALLALGHIDYEESKAMTADQIIRHYDFDHWPILHALGGKDVPWNLRPLLRATHRQKSRKDTSAVAKVKRIVAKQARNAPRKPTGASRPAAGTKAAPKRKVSWMKPAGASRWQRRDSCWKATPPRDIRTDGF